MPVPPGILYVLSSILPKVATPPAVVFAAAGAARYLGLGAHIPWILHSTAGLIVTALGSVVFSAVLYNMWGNWIERREMRALDAVPVPAIHGKWPGNLDLVLQLLRSFKEDYSSQFMEEASVTHGYLYRLRFFGQDMIVTFNPRDVKTILSTDFTNWEKGEKFKSPMKSVLGSGVFNSDGDMWKFHRSMTRPFFSRERISDFEIFRRHTDHAIELIRERCATGEPIDLQDLAGRFTMDSATEFLFGLSVKSMSSPLPLPRTTEGAADKENSFATAFKRSLEACAARLYVGLQWPLWEMTQDTTAVPMKAIHAYMEPIVGEALEKKQRQKQAGMEGTEYKTLLDHLAASTDDPTVVRDELLNILLASRDTTAHAITALFYFLATEDKKITETLREEILRVAGHSTMPTFEQIREMKYLRAVINETLRLMPSVPANIRHAVKSTVWTTEDGTRYYIPKAATGCWSTIGMHRRKDLWGPDALRFDPNRWLDARHKTYFLANPLIFMPFHGGPRICLGQQFALNETSFFVIRLLQAFPCIDFAADGFPPGTLPPLEWQQCKVGRKAFEKVHPKVHVTMFFSGGLWLRLREGGEGALEEEGRSK